MANFAISKAFESYSNNVLDFCRRPGVGFNLPLYQREYSWDVENINQLMEDIFHGVKSLSNDNDDNVIHFLGTIIVVSETNPSENLGLEPEARPEKIFNVIDGQQRISTLALIACLLYEKLYNCRVKCNKKLKKDNRYKEIVKLIDKELSNLTEIFSVDLITSNPRLKPIIIRNDIDKWTETGEDKKYYKSDVALFLAKFIRSITSAETEEINFPKAVETASATTLVSKNLKKIKEWINKVEKAHKKDYDKNDDDKFLPAIEIINNISQENLWGFQRDDLVSLVKEEDNNVCSLVQLMTFSYYLLQRCCFTRIEANSEEWAFDMFQSLNATGTPLTAIETFKPLVVNSITSSGSKFKDSEFEKYFTEIDNLFSSSKDSSEKTKLTNNYLTLLGLIYNGGTELKRRFSVQTKWLTEKYQLHSSLEDKKIFIRQMYELALYWKNVIQFKPNERDSSPKIEGVTKKEREQAELCLVYLQSANHRMGNAILSRFYSNCLRNVENSGEIFVSACKTIAAFFTLWRSSLPNAGLDDVYRELLQQQISYINGDSNLTSTKEIKEYFKEALEYRKIGSKEEWKSKAINRLTYSQGRAICKFALLITSEDTIRDESNLGLMKSGRDNSYPFYLNPNQWISDAQNIEHIAPQNPPSDHDWDKCLYEENTYDKIGNLTLLPTKVNSSASNKTWSEKWFYYKHLAEADTEKTKELQEQAEHRGIKLNPDTIELLTKASYNHHISPIIQLGPDEKWSKNLVDKRTERICDILWDRLNQWLM